MEQHAAATNEAVIVPAYRILATLGMTKYVIEIPDEVRQVLEERASATGGDVSQVLQQAVVSFVRDRTPGSPVGRLPDAPLEAIETLPPCDLPKTGPRPIPIQQISQRLPDPLVDIG